MRKHTHTHARARTHTHSHKHTHTHRIETHTHTNLWPNRGSCGSEAQETAVLFSVQEWEWATFTLTASRNKFRTCCGDGNKVNNLSYSAKSLQ